MSAFKSLSHEKSIFLKIRSFFSFKFLQGHNWLTNYPDSEFHGHWKTVTLSSISPNLSKHWRFFSVLAEFVLWELSIVSSLSLCSVLVQHACNYHAWLTYEKELLLSPKNLIFVKRFTHAFGQKMRFFSVFVSSKKKGLEIRFNDVLDRKETCFDYKNKIFKRLKNHIFSKGLTHAFRQKMEFFSGFVFGQKRTRNKV